MFLDGDGKLFDFDENGRLNSFEQSEMELFEFGDGSMHEPNGVDFYDEDDFDDDEDDDI